MTVERRARKTAPPVTTTSQTPSPDRGLTRVAVANFTLLPWIVAFISGFDYSLRTPLVPEVL